MNKFLKPLLKLFKNQKTTINTIKLDIICFCNKQYNISITDTLEKSTPCNCFASRFYHNTVVGFCKNKLTFYYNMDSKEIIINPNRLTSKTFNTIIRFNYNNNPLNLNDILNKYNRILMLS